MVGRPPKPIDVVLLDGKKHLTKSEIEARRALENKYNQTWTKLGARHGSMQKRKKHRILLSAELLLH